jgi:hypothetical protein
VRWAVSLAVLMLTVPMSVQAADRGANLGNSDCAVMSVAQALQQDEGTCVSLQGFAVDGVMMDHLLDRYRQPQLYNDPSSSGTQIGLMGWRDAAGVSGAARMKAVGVVRLCEAALSSDLLPKSQGADFCDRHSGLFLDVRQAAVLGHVSMPRGLRRDGTALGDLVPVSKHAVRHSMMQVWAVLQRRLAIVGAERLRLMLPEPRPPRLAVDAALQQGSKLEIFGWRVPRWADAGAQAALHQQGTARAEVIACAMRADDAAQNLWPISTRDIGMAADRPYLCVRLVETGEDSQHDDGGDGVNIQYVDGVVVEYLVDENPAVEG